ncbi:MAG: HlyD family efflux transporter periplasmic adaptor subunit [Synechococcales cyanobacterium RM1_1_8]|nr:HlyD family efflux transporter periplasmic adaptor subunit [Synechococcales cyanobacterium RM1_1_8]
MSRTPLSGAAPSPASPNASNGLGSAPQGLSQAQVQANGRGATTHRLGSPTLQGGNGAAAGVPLGGSSEGQGSNGNGNGNGNGSGQLETPSPSPSLPDFDRPVIFRQPPLWSKLILMAIMGVTTFAVGWACLAKVEEAIPAQGKLEPQAAVKEIRAPLGGVVSAIEVREGEQVKQGQVLIRLDQTAAQAQLDSLSEVRAALVAETNYYKSVLIGRNAPLPEGYQVPAGLVALGDNRAALVAENELFRAQLTGTSTTSLDSTQQARLQISNVERNSREAAAQLAIDQQQQQLNQARSRIENTRLQIANAKSQLSNAQSQLKSAEDALAIDSDILAKITPLARDGGIAQIQFLRQQQEVGSGQANVTQQQAEVANRKAELSNQEAELRQLQQEEQRLISAVAQSQEELLNTMARSQQDPLSRIGDNDKRIAEIDSQLNKAIVENEKKINELDSQLSQTKVTLGYQELTAPVSGTVFDLQPTSPGFVSNASEPILKIVPEGSLVAEVFITNKDIGFVYECQNPSDLSTCMDVDVRIDSFPFSEFGDVDGKLIEIGDDALPPDQLFNFFRFPAEVQLAKQEIMVNGQPMQLQSGMSISVNIKTRPRRVITYFTDLFSRKKDSFTSRQ